MDLRYIGSIQDSGGFIEIVGEHGCQPVHRAPDASVLCGAERASLEVHGKLFSITRHKNGITEYIPMTRRDVYNTAHSITLIAERIHTCCTMAQLFQVTCCIVSEWVRYDRGMVYEFDPDWNGQVVYEDVRRSDSHTRQNDISYMGLHFPATDIPEPARDLYFSNKVRVIYDILTPEVPLVGRKRVDLSSCLMRGVAPVHIEYMKNMGTRGSISISLGITGLWGLLVFHSYDGFVGQVDGVACEAFRCISNAFSHKLEAFKQEEDNILLDDARRLLVPPSPAHIHRWKNSYARGLAEHVAHLLDLKCVYMHDNDVLALLHGEPVANIPFSELVDGDSDCDGHLITTICKESRKMHLVRRTATETVRWAGDPLNSFTLKNGVHHPRNSFDSFIQTALRKPRPWTGVQLQVVERLRGCIQEAWAQHEVRLLKEDLEAVEFNAVEKFGVLSGVCHEVRNAIGGILAIFEMYKEERSIDDDFLSVGVESAKFALRLTSDVMMLKGLTCGEVSIFTKVTDTFKFFDALSHHDKRLVVSERCVPYPQVLMDDMRVKQIMLNLVTNALKFSDLQVEVAWATARDTDVMSLRGYATVLGDCITENEDPDSKDVLCVSVTDYGYGMSAEFVNSKLFKPFGQEGRKNYEKGTGLGMVIARSLAVRMKGSLTVGTTLGKGTKFVLCVPVDPVNPNLDQTGKVTES